jgi:aminodeoxyfutalosine deaminase
MAVSLQARVVFPVDRPPIENGFVSIDGPRIVDVGAAAVSVNIIDLGHVAMLPGFVNAHTHLEFSYLSRPLGESGMPLADWIRLVITERARGSDLAQDSIAAGLNESLRCGVTTIGEIAAGDVAMSYGEADVSAFVEVIGFSRARAESALTATVQRLEERARAAGNTRIGISPHAPYTVSPKLLTALIKLAHDRNVPVAMHIAESREELEFLDSGSDSFQKLLEERSMWDEGAIPRGSRPLNYLQLLAEAPRALVIHGNYLADDEWEFLSAHSERMSLVYCPRTHSYFAHPRFPLAQVMAAGVNIALGTDSRASNPDLNFLGEMRHVARLYPQIDPQDILRMGTLSGAQALGRADEVGSITPGKLANLVAIPLPEDAGNAPGDLLAAVLDDDAAPCAVWLRGNVARPSES